MFDCAAWHFKNYSLLCNKVVHLQVYDISTMQTVTDRLCGKSRVFVKNCHFVQMLWSGGCSDGGREWANTNTWMWWYHKSIFPYKIRNIRYRRILQYNPYTAAKLSFKHRSRSGLSLYMSLAISDIERFNTN